MPKFIIETTIETPAREFWQVEAASRDEAREAFERGEVGAFLWDEVQGDETDREIAEVHDFADLAGTIALHNAQQQAPAMLAALSAILSACDGFKFDSDADVFRLLDKVREIAAPVVAADGGEC